MDNDMFELVMDTGCLIGLFVCVLMLGVGV